LALDWGKKREIKCVKQKSASKEGKKFPCSMGELKGTPFLKEDAFRLEKINRKKGGFVREKELALLRRRTKMLKGRKVGGNGFLRGGIYFQGDGGAPRRKKDRATKSSQGGPPVW